MAGGTAREEAPPLPCRLLPLAEGRVREDSAATTRQGRYGGVEVHRDSPQEVAVVSAGGGR